MCDSLVLHLLVALLAGAFLCGSGAARADVVVAEDFDDLAIPSTLSTVEGSVVPTLAEGRTYLKIGSGSTGRSCIETSAALSRANDLIVTLEGWVNGGGVADFWATYYEALGAGCTPTNGYRMDINPVPSDVSIDYISRIVNGSGEFLATTPREVPAGQWFSAQYHFLADGTLRLVVNDEVRVQAVDSTFDLGKFLLRSWGEIRLDSLKICTGPHALQDCSAVDVPVFSCQGFEPPLENTVTVRQNRALPFKASLFDADGFAVTDLDVEAAPVIQVLFASDELEEPVDVSSEALPAGQSTEGNEFFFASDGYWHFNLKTSNYTAAGTYFVFIQSGDDAQYQIDETCEGSFAVR